MDQVINRLRNTVSTVTSTVSQLSVVLPGNGIFREYEVTSQIASGGPGLFWKIYSGSKKSTRQEASIFVFEKKEFDKWRKKDRDRMVETLKKGVQQLTKLRHPRILTVQHPLEESRDSLAFATEPVLGSLANVLGNLGNIPTPLTSGLKDYSLDEVDIKYGLLQIAEGLQFLNKDAKLVHGNLCPECVILSEQGSWKIGGLEFAISSTLSEGQWVGVELDAESHHDSWPNLNYLAPEYETKPSPQSDVFSLGMLSFAVFNNGETLRDSGGNLQAHRYNLSKTDMETLSDGKLRHVPKEMRPFLRSLLKVNPELRPDAHHFSKLDYLADERVKTLIYLDTLFQWDNLQKSKFFKGLPQLLEKLPHRVRLYRVVPSLAGELLNPQMVPFVLPNILKVGEWSTNEEFVRHVLPHLREAMKIQEPIQVPFIFLKSMDLLLQKTPSDIQKSDILPLLYAALDTDSAQLQELVLGIVPSLAQRFDHAAMKNQLLPRIRKVTLATQTLSVRVNCLLCLGKILEDVEKWLVVDFVLPFVTEIPNREPPVIMAILGILKVAATHRKLGLTKELIATRVLPFLFPLSIENGLEMRQLEALLAFIHELIAQVTKEQKAKIVTIQANEVTSDSSFGVEGLFLGLQNGAPIQPQKDMPITLLSPTAAESGSNQHQPPKPQQPKDLSDSLIHSQINQITISPRPVAAQTASSNYKVQGFPSQQPLPFQKTFSAQQSQTFQNPQYFLSQQYRPLTPLQNFSPQNDQGSAKALSQREIDELLK